MRSLLIIALATIGCAARSQTQQAVPQPSTFRLNGTVQTDLPRALSAQSGLPPVLSGTLEARASADAISSSPPRSRHEGHMSFVVTDGAGKSIVDIKIDVEGESDGPPNEALKQAMKRFLDAAALIARPFEQLEQGSAASPATQR